jgi:hypothetical protein
MLVDRHPARLYNVAGRPGWSAIMAGDWLVMTGKTDG